MKGKFVREYIINKWKKMGTRVIPCTACQNCCCQWSSSSMHEENSIPGDVPKGHLVVYVGDNRKRFVIKIKLLNHPLFKALLDLAQEEYDFMADSKLCIPCDERLFRSVLRCATFPQNQGDDSVLSVLLLLSAQNVKFVTLSKVMPALDELQIHWTKIEGMFKEEPS
ncbi:Indole-3-acetic acid-induced protein ARG7 [Senna tora]|uniref:Indole-3-acetic acid-induced protein ARG7 n=1 Tax=Senna tora TaxID=362788 RepID=A0A834W0M5_9FABA|nr:Indole-3-acetic acid-induced protein ARG7 [Senna tora]